MQKSTFLIKSSNNRSFGTGFVVYADKDGSYLVTCCHVVEECETEFLEVEGKKAELFHQGSSDGIDLAVIYVEGLTNTKVLNLCSETITKSVLVEINGFKPHKRESFKFEKLNGVIKKVSEIHALNETIKTYELSLEKDDSIEKGYSGSAVLLKGTNSVIAVATDRNRNGKDAYAIPIAYLKEIWKEIPVFVTCNEEMEYKGIEKIPFLKKMENQALNTIGGVIVMAVITGFIYDYLKPKDTTEETVKIEATKTHTNLEEIKALIKLQGGDETAFLEKYFGEEYKTVLENPQTYQNLKLKLSNNKKTTQELLEERDELLKKISLRSLKGSVQKMIDKAFKELRYDDVRDLLDSFIENNQAIGDDLIKAHYQKALTYIEELKYYKAKAEFEEFIPLGIKDAEILHEYGSLYYKLGEYDKSLECHTKALALNIKEFGENYVSVATNYNEIGGAWDSKGEYDKAIEFYNKALKIYLSTLGENHPSTATSYNNIGLAWKNKGEYDKAIKFYNRAVKIKLNILGENHHSTVTTYNNLGSVWNRKGEYDKAIEFFNKALKIELAILGENHPSTAISYNNIGLVYFNKGDYDQAIEVFNKALKIELVTLGENHPSTATCYNNIGSAWNSKGEYDKALGFHNRALKVRVAILGEKHPDTAMSYNNIGLAYLNKEEYEKAIEFFNRALKIRVSTLGEKHPLVATSYNNIGGVWNSRGEYEKAIEFYDKALKIRLARLGENHLLTAISYNNIGEVWERKGEYSKAIEFYNRSLKILIATVGENHPYVEIWKDNLKRAKKKFDNFE